MAYLQLHGLRKVMDQLEVKGIDYKYTVIGPIKSTELKKINPNFPNILTWI